MTHTRPLAPQGPARPQAGVGIIEAMVTLVILGVGLLAMYSFQGDILRAGASAKARTEAVQLAQDKIDELRAAVTQADFAALSGGQDTMTGSHASFTRTWVLTHRTAPARREVTVQVTWSGPDGSQSVTLDSLLAFSDPTMGALLSVGGLPGGGGVTPPFGGAVYGDNIADYDPDDLPEEVVAQGFADGTLSNVVLYDNAGTFELIDADSGLVLLSSSTPLATISGRIYIDLKNGAPIMAPDYVFAGAPDVSYCTNVQRDANDQILYVQAGGVDTFAYTNYQCFVGASWYGSVGVLVQAPGDTSSELGPNDEGCVGDPAAADTGASDSRHPQLSLVRAYRGYSAIVVNGLPQIDAFGNRLYLSSGVGANDAYVNDDFLITTIEGGATDTDCAAAQAMAPVEFAGNVGTLVCLSASCPTPLPVDVSEPVASLQSWTISGQTQGVGSLAGVVTSDGDSCELTVGGSYQCVVFDLGDGWTGYVEGTASTGYVITDGERRNFTALGADSNVAGNDFTLAAAENTVLLTVSGAIATGKQAEYLGLAIAGGSCTYPTKGNGSPKDGNYRCTVADFVSGSSVSLTVNTPDQLCAAAQGTVNANTLTLDTVTADVSVDLQIETSCP